MAKKIAEAFIQLNATGLQGITGTLSRLRGVVAGTVSAFGQLGLAISGLKMIGSGLLSIVSTPLQLAAEAEQIEVAMETMIGSAARARSVLGSLYELGAKTPFEFTDLAKASRTLLSFGEDVNELLSDVEMLSNIAAGDPEKLQSLAMVFGQIQSTGRLMGQDLLQLINQGFNPLQQISERTGESMGALKKRMEEGRIPFAEIKQAFVDATSEGGRFYQMNEKQSQTLAGVWSTLQDNIGQALIKIGKAIAENLDLKGIILKVSGWIEELIEIFSVLTANWHNAWEIMKLTVVAAMQSIGAMVRAAVVEWAGFMLEKMASAWESFKLKIAIPFADEQVKGHEEKINALRSESQAITFGAKGREPTADEKARVAAIQEEIAWRQEIVDNIKGEINAVEQLGKTHISTATILNEGKEAAKDTVVQIKSLFQQNKQQLEQRRDRQRKADEAEIEAEEAKGKVQKVQAEGAAAIGGLGGLQVGIAMAQAMAGLVDKIPKLMTTSMTDITSVNRSIQESMEKRRIDLQKLALEHHKRTNELIQQHIEVTKRGQSGAAFA